jgi:hypothetical protein
MNAPELGEQQINMIHPLHLRHDVDYSLHESLRVMVMQDVHVHALISAG